MNKSLLILSLLLTISLSTSAETLFPSDNTDLKPNITELKGLYATRAKYATYVTIAGLASCAISLYNKSFGAVEISKLCASTSAIFGLGNGTKWLFLHLFPESTASDIDAINILEKLAYATLALQLPDRAYRISQCMC